ncbi:hypothetical protein [Capnocytophaga catalasegens]|uniref:Uncharacterized protein n=1 Tax=Capnocytophaga catalasegens TaxID=1004260 RepID=A0AAV5AZT7_9FLAO|nr:hypothetical protein [Capnocytophaga catalasegens]GIZ16638.1 hypothetical protein RCZ03_26380 [Capnocytophaga catalasegens]GJM51661.1 hypothetical protein RCZ15_26340 [Capnocytophaga catalasegens]GJM54010.1 hypothetical protein RCZ16_23260 [Capnocytophaga catalasegens]
MKNEADYKTLLHLRDKINENTATFEEQKQYVYMLTQEGKFSQEQYQAFAQKSNLQNNILNAALAIGGIILTAWLISELSKTQK